jgi:hypothetical protein
MRKNEGNMSETSKSKTAFTSDDLNDWQAFERVRKSGRWNMYDPHARRATGLSSERYSFVMHNFTKLKAAAEDKEP